MALTLLSALTERVVEVYRTHRRLGLLFDFDGTLVPLAPHPELAVLECRCRRALEQLSRLPRVFVGVVSGRSLDELMQLVDLAELYYAGVSGLELDLAGTRIRHPAATRSVVLVRHVIERIEAAVGEFPGAWVENKQYGATVHFRHVDPRLIPRLRARVAQILEGMAEPLQLGEGRRAFELAPAAVANGSTAVQAMIRYLGGRTGAFLYAGDDAGDCPAFAEVARSGGICVGVGPDAPQTAEFRFESPAELTAFLGQLAHELAVHDRAAR